MKAAKIVEIGWIILPKNASQKHNRRAYKIGSDHLNILNIVNGHLLSTLKLTY